MNELPRVLFPLVMREVGLRDQKAVSETCRKFNQWTYELPEWAADRSMDVETIRREIAQRYKAYSQARVNRNKAIDVNAVGLLLSRIPTGIDALMNTYSTLFGRSFVEKVKTDPVSFIRSGNLTPRVLAILGQIPEKAIAAIDAEIAKCDQQPFDLVKLYEEGKLEGFIQENRDRIAREYKLEQELFGDGNIDQAEPDDITLLEFAANSVKDYYADQNQLTGRQKELLDLKQRLSEHPRTKEPVIHSDSDSPRSDSPRMA